MLLEICIGCLIVGAVKPNYLLPRVLVLDHFDFDSSVLKPDHLTKLDSLVKEFKQQSERFNNRLNVKISIIGHTDYIGTSEYNLDLGLQRAKKVNEYIKNQLKPRFGKMLEINYKSAGEDLPVSKEKSKSGRAKNRRVYIVTEQTLLEPPSKTIKGIVKKPHRKIVLPSWNCIELKKMQYFRTTYFGLISGMTNSILNIDREGNLHLSNVPYSYLESFSRNTQDEILGFFKEKTLGKFEEIVFSKSVLTGLGWVVNLVEIHRYLENERIANNLGDQKYQKKAEEAKFRLLIEMLANDWYRANPWGTTVGKEKIRIRNLFRKYDKLQRKCPLPVKQKGFYPIN